MKYKYKGFKAYRNTFVDKKSRFSENVVLYSKSEIHNSFIGRATYVAGSIIGNSDIGAFCSIGPNSRIGYLGSHPTNFISTHPAFYSTLRQANLTFVSSNYYNEFKRITIGNDVWIGANCLILDGISIGNGAIIAAGSVVVKDVNAYSIIGGNPAKFIRYRFDEKEIEYLEELKWWEWNYNDLSKYAHIFRDKKVLELYHLNSINN